MLCDGQSIVIVYFLCKVSKPLILSSENTPSYLKFVRLRSSLFRLEEARFSTKLKQDINGGRYNLILSLFQHFDLMCLFGL